MEKKKPNLVEQIEKGQIKVPEAVLRKISEKPLTHCQNPGELPEHLIGVVKQWWLERAPYPDLVERLKKEGYNLYGPTITNWCRKTWPDVIAETAGDEPTNDDLLSLSTEKQSIELLWRKSLHAIRTIRSDSKTAKQDLNIMAGTIGRIAAAQSALEKLEQERVKAGGDKVKLLEQAKEQLKGEIRRLIGNKPKLVDELCDVFDDAASGVTMMN